MLTLFTSIVYKNNSDSYVVDYVTIRLKKIVFFMLNIIFLIKQQFKNMFLYIFENLYQNAWVVICENEYMLTSKCIYTCMEYLF